MNVRGLIVALHHATVSERNWQAALLGVLGSATTARPSGRLKAAQSPERLKARQGCRAFVTRAGMQSPEPLADRATSRTSSGSLRQLLT
jgi:hypothetical protein